LLERAPCAAQLPPYIGSALPTTASDKRPDLIRFGATSVRILKGLAASGRDAASPRGRRCRSRRAIAEMRPRGMALMGLSRIAQRPRTALPDQCLHSAEADVRPPRSKSGFGPIIEIGRSLNRTAANKKYRLVCRQPKPNQVPTIERHAQIHDWAGVRRRR
jgi:hypothetical protein